MIVKKETMRSETRTQMRGGNGNILLTHLLEKDAMLGKARLCAKITVEPGCSIGTHPHGPDAEIYILVSGTLSVNDNGKESVLNAGDVMFTGNGESHSVENKGKETAVMYAVVLE